MSRENLCQQVGARAEQFNRCAYFHQLEEFFEILLPHTDAAV